MRQVLAVAIAVLCFSLQPIHAQEPTPLHERPATVDDDVADALWSIAVASNIRLGFQAIERTRMPHRLNDIPALAGGSINQALDAVLAADGRYEWRVVGGVAVVRPKGAWREAADPLNQRVKNLQITAAPVALLDAFRNFAELGRFEMTHPSTRGVVSLRVDSGTMLDLLNALTIESDNVMWLASYRTSAQVGPDAGTVFELRCEKGLNQRSSNGANWWKRRQRH